MTCKDTPEIVVMLSTMIKGKAPQGWRKNDWARYHSSFRETKTTPHGLAVEIWKGHGFTPIFKHRRKEENFVEAYHIAFDFDNDGAALDFLMRDGTFANLFASFAYSTPSSTPDHPKSRVVFVFDYPITTPQLYRELYQAIAWRFAEEGSYCDPQCKDPLRLFFGSPNCQVIGNWSLLTQQRGESDYSTIDLIISQYREVVPIKAAPSSPPIQPSLHTAVPQSYIDHHIQKTLDHLRYAANGERHLKRRDISRAMGGYVAAGHIPYMDALNLLIDAALATTDDPKLAEQEVRDGLEYGMKEPLYIEYEVATSLGDLLS